MSEELLDKADIRAAFQHVRGARVAEEVAASASAQVRFVDVLADRARKVIGVIA